MSFPRDTYPYTNFHELNLGYFIVHFREIFSQWADLYDQMTDWKDATDEELATWKAGVEADLDQREAALRAELETWKTQTGQDIAGWEDATLAALTAWQTATQAVFEAIRVEAAGSASAAAASAGDAATAKTAAETAQAAAEAAAASIQASAAQITTNTEDIADLKTQINKGQYNIDVTWTNGFYVNNVQRTLSEEANTSVSDLIELHEGDVLVVKNGRSNAATVVDMISEWTAGGNYVKSIYAYQAAFTFEDYTYTVTKENEYIRLCTLTARTGDIIVYVNGRNLYNINRTLTELETNVDGLSNEVDALYTGNNLIIPVSAEWTDGFFVNNVQHTLTPLEGFSYSSLIHLKKDEILTIKNGRSNTASVVDMLSKWTQNGSYVSSIYAYATVNTFEDYTYTATDNDEYVRLCTLTNYKSDMISGVNGIGIIGLNKELPAIKNTEELVNNTNTFLEISTFKTLGLCGDSYTAAQFYTADGALIGDIPDYSWGNILGRLSGIDVSLYASSGADTSTWQTRSSCLPALLADTAKDCYLFALGINDYSTINLGTIADIKEDYTENPNTFFGNFGRIIEQIKNHAPNAKIVLMKCWLVGAPYYTYSSDAIEEICEHYSIPYLDTRDSMFLMSNFYRNTKYVGHPTLTQQGGMAKAVKILIEKSMEENPTYYNKMN